MHSNSGVPACSAESCNSAFKCRCGRLSEDVEDIIRHVGEVHCSEFNIRNLDVLEDVLDRIVTPSPLQAYRKAFVVEGL